MQILFEPTIFSIVQQFPVQQRSRHRRDPQLLKFYFTLILTVFFRLPTSVLHVIVHVPFFLAVTFPVEDTAATFLLLLDHLTLTSVRPPSTTDFSFTLLPFLTFTGPVSFPPYCTLRYLGRFLQITFTCLICSETVLAVTIALPAFLQVILPFCET